MGKAKTIKSKTEFKNGFLALLKAHNIEVAELEQEKLAESMLTFFNNRFAPPKEVTPYWSEIVSLYFQTYTDITGQKPAFLGTESKALKEISKVLMERYLRRTNDGIWSLESCLSTFKKFYEAMCTIHNVKTNFSISYLFHNFDKLTSQLSAKK